MDTLFGNHPNALYKLKFSHQPVSASPDKDSDDRCKIGDNFTDVSEIPCELSLTFNVKPFEGVQEDTQVESDYFDGVLRYINQMLNEEDLDDRPCMFQDCSALQAAEKSFYDVLNEGYPPPCRVVGEESVIPYDDFSSTLCNYDHNSSQAANDVAQSYLIHDQGEAELFVNQQAFQFHCRPCYTSSSLDDVSHGFMDLPISAFQSPDHSSTRKSPSGDNYNHVNHRLGSSDEEAVRGRITSEDNPPNKSGENGNGMGSSPNDLRSKTNHHRQEDDYPEGRKNKQFASCSEEESEKSETYDKALLCPTMSPNFYGESPSVDSSEISSENEAGKWKDYSRSAKRGRPRASGKKGNKKEVVDLRGLLTQCTQAVSICDGKTVGEVLKQIRQYSSPYGDATERLSHYFANALEARLHGTGPALYTALTSRKVAAAHILKAYQTYVTACPFKRMSNIFANKSIAKQVGEASRVHIIDFGILYGFQWPCIIHGLSLRPGGRPKIRITGIDFPQAGFRPAERIEKTGERLANYCKRFNIPFEYTAIAKKWDAITLEDLKIDREETVVVNCLYRLRHVPDESVNEMSPRDTVLDLIKKINPDIFVHGVLNGTYNASFFATRFREALFHFSSLFDIFETTIPREDQDRLLFEKEVLGRDIMNIIACEGNERIERPETYKQWQVRNQRAGFWQLPLNQNIMREVRAKVRWYYHRDFLLDEDSNWMLQGWKGRVIYALSCWKPIDK